MALSVALDLSSYLHLGTSALRAFELDRLLKSLLTNVTTAGRLLIRYSFSSHSAALFSSSSS